MKRSMSMLIAVVILTPMTIFGSVPAGFVPNEESSDSRDFGPSQSVININNMAYWMKKSSAGTTSGSPNGAQADYPIGTGGLIYEDGMLWGAKVTDGNNQRVRVNGTTYYAGVKAGRVIYDTNGNVVGATDPALHHVWRVRTDYLTADLTSDAANFLMINYPSEAAIQDVYDQYSYDWTNWPAGWGAPYEDVDEDGAYDPAVDIPGYPGAAQTLWVVANDVPPIVDENGVATGDTLETSENIYGADPIGVELQVTMWAYNHGASDPLGNVIFKKAKMKYTGLPTGYNDFDPAIAHLDTVYFTQWSDPDLGTYTDDYVGCDVDLSLGYVYNGNALDGVFDGVYNMSVPAGGYDIFQGPEVDGEYLPMTAFTYFGAGAAISDPDFSYDGTLQFFNLMEGFLPRPKYPIQEPWIDIITGEVTNFVLSGDPLTGEGWIDGIQLPPGDRRMVMASGPFAMEIGETQEIVLALIGGHGADNLTSISVLKYHDQFAQYAYNNNFNLPSPPIEPEVSITPLTGSVWAQNWLDLLEEELGWYANTSYAFEYLILDSIIDLSMVNDMELALAQMGITDFDASTWTTHQVWSIFNIAGTNRIVLNWSTDFGQTEEDDPVFGFDFQGYNVYQLPYPGASIDEAVRLATFDVIDNITTIWSDVLDPELGYIINIPVQFGTNSGLQRFITIDMDHITDGPVIPNQEYYFAVTAYNANIDTDFPITTLESSFDYIVTSVGEAPDLDYISDSYVTVDHTGTAGGGVDITLISPDQLTGNDYEVYFDLQHYYMDVDGFWKFTDYPDSVGTAGKILDVSPSSVTGFAYTSPAPGTRDLKFIVDIVSPDYNYAAGVKLTFPIELTINSVEAPAGIAAMISTDGSNSAMFGDTIVDGWGDFAGGEMLTVNISTPTLPLDVEYIIYDDGWATLWCVDNPNTCLDYQIGPGFTETVNAEGTCTITTETFAFKTLKHWNLKDLTTGMTLLEDQTLINGVQLEAIEEGVYYPGGYDVGLVADPIVDGFQIHVDALYDTPLDAESITATGPNNPEWCVGFNQSGTVCDYNVDSYMGSGWATDATAVTTYGSGTSSMDVLQRDVAVFFDGVYGDPITTPSGALYYPVVEGGSQAWVYSASSMADHPENTSGGSDPFLVTVPFKVYDLEAGDEPVQIGMIMRDRIQSYDGSDPTLYAFNPDDRMYTWFINRPYEETLADFSSNEALLTWNVVWWNQQWVAGDQLTFVYDNAIQQGVDTYSFTTIAPAEFAIEKGDVNDDEEVNISDAVMLINYLLQITDLETDAQLFASDFNSDYAINIADVVGIINAILNQSARTMASFSDAENATVSVPEMMTLQENTFGLPLNITADGSIAALQLELSYDHQVLTPQAPRLDEELWSGINVLYNSPEEGKVIYLFYSMSGIMIPVDKTPAIEFENISGNSEPSSSIELLNAVLADINGTSVLIEYGNRVAKTSAIPETYVLYPNYPNPFNPITNIEYNLPEMSHVTVQIYNIVGQQVCTLVNRSQMSGHYRIQWNGRNDYGKLLASGVYLIRFKANDFTRQQKIMLLK